MSRVFRISEEVEVANVLGDYAFLNGMRVTIIGTLKEREMINLGRHQCYRVETAGGIQLAFTPDGLRPPMPTRGDMNKVVHWDDCKWQPRSDA